MPWGAQLSLAVQQDDNVDTVLQQAAIEIKTHGLVPPEIASVVLEKPQTNTDVHLFWNALVPLVRQYTNTNALQCVVNMCIFMHTHDSKQVLANHTVLSTHAKALLQALRGTRHYTVAAYLIMTFPHLRKHQELLQQLDEWAQSGWSNGSSLLYASLSLPMANASDRIANVLEMLHGCIQRMCYEQVVPSVETLLQDVSTPEDFVALVTGLVETLRHLLLPHSWTRSSLHHLQQVPTKQYLQITQILLELPLASERRYLSTKKRLRTEAAAHAFSIQQVCDMSNALCRQGYGMLQTLVQSTPCLPWAYRLVSLVYDSVVTTAPLSIRHALDATVSLQSKRWLFKCAVTRQAAVTSFGLVISKVGVLPQKKGIHSQVHQGLQLLVALLLDEADTSTEHAALDASILKALTQCMRTGGEYWPLELRNLMESVVAGRLENMSGGSWMPQRPNGNVVLELGVACLAVPWIDGATSGLCNVLRRAAEANPGLAASNGALRQCDQVLFPAVRPMLVRVRREQSEDAAHQGLQQDLMRSRQVLQVTQEKMMQQEQQEKEGVIPKLFDFNKNSESSSEEKAEFEIKTTTELSTETLEKQAVDAKETAISSDALKPLPLAQNSTSLPASSQKPADEPENKRAKIELPVKTADEADDDDGMEDIPDMVVDGGPDEDDMDD